MRRLAYLLVLAAFVFSSGGQWSLLQGLAWANMIREYAHAVPLAQAVQMTLSGEYPCPLCKAIAEKKNSEQQKALTLDKHDHKFVLPVACRPFSPAGTPLVYGERPQTWSSRGDPPLSPPPRPALS